MVRVSYALVVCLIALAAAPPAFASEEMQVGLAGDGVTRRGEALTPDTVRKWQQAGVEVTRVVAAWNLLTPEPDSASAPEGFDAADPDDPAYDWSAVDATISLLLDRGIEPILSITGPGPVWGSREPARKDGRYRPDPALFARFASAVATRYSGRVKRFLLWSEPNSAGTLRPQFSCRRRRCQPVSPDLYRDLWQAAVPEVREAAPGAEVYLGSTASLGSRPRSADANMRPLLWLRSLGCIDRRLEPDRSGRGCTSPGTLEADGVAYHVNTRLAGPAVRSRNPDEAGLADSRRILRTIDAMQAAGTVTSHSGAGGRLDLFFTEWGFETNPPDPFSGVSLSAQASWLQQGAWLAWRQPRVKMLLQQLWRDEPVRDRGRGLDAYSGHQSGLYFYDGRRKPARETWPQPFWTTLSRGSTEATLWGQVRPGGEHVVTIERKGGAGFVPLTTLTTNPLGYFTAKATVRRRGTFRFTWRGSDNGAPDRRMASSPVTLVRRR